MSDGEWSTYRGRRRRGGRGGNASSSRDPRAAPSPIEEENPPLGRPQGTPTTPVRGAQPQGPPAAQGNIRTPVRGPTPWTRSLPTSPQPNPSPRLERLTTPARSVSPATTRSTPWDRWASTEPRGVSPSSSNGSGGGRPSPGRHGRSPLSSSGSGSGRPSPCSSVVSPLSSSGSGSGRPSPCSSAVSALSSSGSGSGQPSPCGSLLSQTSSNGSESGGIVSPWSRVCSPPSSAGSRSGQPSPCPSVSSQSSSSGSGSGRSSPTLGIKYNKRSSRRSSVQKELSQLKLNDPDLKRPLREEETGPLTQCSKIQVTANHFEIKVNANFPSEIFHYDVTIKPSTGDGSGAPPERAPLEGGRGGKQGELPDRIMRAIWEKFEETFASDLKTATPFDGKKNCFTARRLEFDGQDGFNFKLDMADPDDPDKRRGFNIILKLVSVVSTAAFWKFLQSSRKPLSYVELPQEIVQCLEVALRAAPASKYTLCNRSFFHPIGSKHLEGCLEMWYGHYQALCLGSDEKATFNIDLATKAFYKKMSVSDFLRTNLGLSQSDSLDLAEWDKDSIQKASEALRGKLIEYGTGQFINGKYEKYHKFPAVGLVEESARTFQFTSGETKMSIEEYMKDVKGTKIRNPNYPCLHIGSQKMTNYIPLELADIVPQVYRGKMGNSLTTAMITGAAVPPVERFEKIQASRKGCYYESCKVLKEFGLEVQGTMTKIEDGKRLYPPTIITRNNGHRDERTGVHKTTGKWGFSGHSNRQRQFLNAATVPKLGILDCTDTEDNILRKFLIQLSEAGEAHGMTGFQNAARWDCRIVEKVHMHSSKRYNFGQEVALKLDKMKKNGVELVIVIISKDGREYASVKAEAEVKVGVLTACIKNQNVKFIKPQNLSNYLLKLNTKLNGMNWSVGTLDRDFFQEPVIIFGADVTHPPKNSNSPSIAAVTASYNVHGMGYNVHIQAQEAKKELIDRIGDVVEKMLKDFYNKSRGKKPKKLIMFRDGVSEGMFDQIKHEEYKEIQKVCREMTRNDPEPIKITFVVVKKRHNTRFQPCCKDEGVGAGLNIPPGTVVDTQVVHPTEQEFFVNSHVGIKGTSRPTKYHVIHDDNKFTTSQMQKLTYFLCYAFVRCTQPVSYPAATYYAHLAAKRAKHLIEKDGDTSNLKELQDKLTIHEDLLKKYPMFYV